MWYDDTTISVIDIRQCILMVDSGRYYHAQLLNLATAGGGVQHESNVMLMSALKSQ